MAYRKERVIIKVNRVEQQFIHKSHPLYEIVDRHCFYSKNVYNQANYIIRQAFTKENEIIKANDIQKLMQCRFVPKGEYYIMEIVYEIDVPDCSEEINRVCAVDLGVENFITVVNNFGEQPFIIKGGALKSTNQYYNKQKAKLQSKLKKNENKDWSKRLEKLTNKRYEKIKYLMHCISKQLVDYCVLHNVDTLVIGLNKKWKQENGSMQNFTYIPYDLFINQVKSKCEQNGIKCIIVQEAYTSGTSFLDGELPTKENYDKERRVYRGLFVSKSGKTINADVNGAYQIMKKVVPDVFNKGIEDVGLHPLRLKVA